MNTHGINPRPLRPVIALTFGLLIAVATAGAACGPAQASEYDPSAEHELTYANPDTIREAVYRMESAYEGVNDYTAIFYKRERVRGRMLPWETMEIKFRKPFAVYLRWLDGKKKDQESLFVKGWNNNKIMAHPGSFPDITVSLSPDSSLAMRGNRHPITDCGIGHIIELITRDMRRSEANPDDNVRFLDHGYSYVYGARSRCVEAIMPTAEDSGYYGHRAKICMDASSELPNRVQIWDRENNLIEDYGFKDLRVNPGLTGASFDPENPEYGF
ncbi:MAG: DUF1571 domain-containing protein [Myxococcales bacterium]|nr:DUF1571 domain-containing protein [Myxococcales bacterium]